MEGVTQEEIRARIMQLRMRTRNNEHVEDEELMEAIRLIRAGRQSANNATKAKRTAGPQINLNDLLPS